MTSCQHSPLSLIFAFDILDIPPLPAANTNKHQYWTCPILTRKHGPGLSTSAVLNSPPPNFKPSTLKGLAVLKEYWQRYTYICSDRTRDRTSLTYS
ncbi:hypothetical protein BDW59DRAFT_77720 [Aspergillus cavernicola]|uniref:Uncharacterized protein n=1 Tax=Aspergillus cavernicola TaxID=176166 RepID=A0ABR4J182_9EURO